MAKLKAHGSIVFKMEKGKPEGKTEVRLMSDGYVLRQYQALPSGHKYGWKRCLKITVSPEQWRTNALAQGWLQLI